MSRERQRGEGEGCGRVRGGRDHSIRKNGQMNEAEKIRDGRGGIGQEGRGGK